MLNLKARRFLQHIMLLPAGFILIGFAGCAPASETSLLKNSQIVFVSDRANNHDLFITNMDGTGLRSLTNLPTVDSEPSWHPDGSKIIFHSYVNDDFDIYTINVDGSELTRLTNVQGNDNWPKWSPDGSLIAFGTDRTGNRRSLSHGS